MPGAPSAFATVILITKVDSEREKPRNRKVKYCLRVAQLLEPWDPSSAFCSFYLIASWAAVVAEMAGAPPKTGSRAGHNGLL